MSNLRRAGLTILFCSFALCGANSFALESLPFFTVTTTLTAYIGPELKFSLDGTGGATAVLVGYAYKDKVPLDALNQASAFAFDLRSNAPVDFGSAHLFSNLSGGVVIRAISKNGGKLVADSERNSSSIDYELLVDGVRVPYSAGAFTFFRPGKSSWNNQAIKLAIYVKNRPDHSASSTYSDEITFLVSAP